MNQEHIHLIGIGGIGVSALARLYRAQGYRISGSDLSRSEITDALKKEGIRVFIGHKKSNLAPTVKKVVMSIAVRRENPEIREALRRSLPIRTYAEALGELAKKYKTIAVAGAHGKSTTTALTALILAKAGLNPTVIVGTKLKEFGHANFRPGRLTGLARGRSRYFVLEADEYRASFLNYSPSIAAVTNIDREHLDFYQNVRNIAAAFFAFLRRLKPHGTAVLNRDDPRLRRIGVRLRRARRDVRILWFSLRSPEARKVKGVIRIPGRHNVENALAAYALGRALAIPKQKILAAIHSYRGAWRRFEYQGRWEGARVFADYAHHPTEIKATLQAAREKFPRANIWCVFQPHHYERTRDLFPDFTKAFDQCDRVVMLDIYEVAGREHNQKSKNINSANLARAVARRGVPAHYLPQPRRLKAFLEKRLRGGEVLLMMGAGSIWEMTKALVKSEK